MTIEHRLVLVEWEDSLGVGERWDKVDPAAIIAEPIVCSSVGWLVKEGERAIVLVPHIHPADDRRRVASNGIGDMTIPKCAVLRMVDLSEPAPSTAT